MHRAGKLGGLAAWLGFTLPSAIVLTALALWARNLDLAGAGWVHGLELAAAAVVLTAVIAMARTLARGPVKALIAIAATAVALVFPGTFGQLATILVAGAIGGYLFRGRMQALPLTLAFPISRRTAIVCAQLLVLLFFVPLWLANTLSSHSLRLFDSFYGAGALVFGGGHVVLPLLNEAVVVPGWVSSRRSWPATAPPRPCPGRCSRSRPTWARSRIRRRTASPAPAIALVAIFLPSFLLLGVALPLWSAARERIEIQAAVAGIGAAVVGLLAAALWNPVLSTSVHGAGDAVVVVLLFLLLRFLPPWAVVGIAALAGAALF